MTYDFQIYMYALVIEMQKKEGYPLDLGNARNLLEYRTLILKTPRQVGKSFLINHLATTETNPIIFIGSRDRGNYAKILHKHVRDIKNPIMRGERINKITAIFFDEIQDVELINRTIAEVAAHNNTVSYALALYT